MVPIQMNVWSSRGCPEIPPKAGPKVGIHYQKIFYRIRKTLWPRTLRLFGPVGYVVLQIQMMKFMLLATCQAPDQARAVNKFSSWTDTAQSMNWHNPSENQLAKRLIKCYYLLFCLVVKCFQSFKAFVLLGLLCLLCVLFHETFEMFFQFAFFFFLFR